MTNTERREKIIQLLEKSQSPISGSRLAAELGVSRQVIVQDIALLRTEQPILSTAQGYLLHLNPQSRFRRSFSVRHNREQIADELLTIIEYGGRIMDVVVEHDVYGQIRADLNLRTAADVRRFCTLLKNSSSGPLFPISDGLHLHTVEADSAQALEQIQQALEKKGYLVSD